MVKSQFVRNATVSDTSATIIIYPAKEFESKGYFLARKIYSIHSKIKHNAKTCVPRIIFL